MRPMPLIILPIALMSIVTVFTLSDVTAAQDKNTHLPTERLLQIEKLMKS